jgi:hypothetical protein
MAEFVDSTVKEIDGRINLLREEVTRLEAARAALIGTRRGRPNGSAPESPRTRTRTRTRGGTAARPGRPRGRRGGNTRANQALELVRKKPGITIPQLAVAMKIEPNYLYRVMPRLVSDGQVKREGQGWRPAS